MDGEMTDTATELAELRAKVETLEGNVIALELALGAALTVAAVGRGDLVREAIANSIETIPGLLDERYGLDSKPAFQDGIKRTIANLTSQMRLKI